MVLLFMVCLLAMLALCAGALLCQARLSSKSGASAVARSQAVLGAASGLEYAAARLIQSPEILPLRATAYPGPGEDWVCRSPVQTPLGLARHPSYGHGDPWADTVPLNTDGLDNDGNGLTDEAGEGKGIWSDLEGYADRDGDGVFSGCSGRLRGAGGGGLRFSLRIEAQDGKIPLNAGYLGDQGRMDPSVPDYREFGTGTLVHPYHKGLEHVLNNLGVLCGVATRRETHESGDSGNPANWIETSWLGYDLLSRRPPGGYRSLAQVRQTMLEAGYPVSDFEKVSPYLDAGLRETLGESGRVLPADGADLPGYAPVNLSAAPKPVLASLWMYLAANPPSEVASITPSLVDVTLPGELNCWDRISSRTGSWVFGDTLLMLYRDEAERLADSVIGGRDEESWSWQVMYQDWSKRAPVLFVRDAVDLGDGNGNGKWDDDEDGYADVNPVAVRNWTQAKADLAFQAVTVDPFPYPEVATSGAFAQNPADARVGGMVAWASRGIDREVDPILLLPYQAVSFSRIRRVEYPRNYPASFPAATPPWGPNPDDRFIPYDAKLGGAANTRPVFIKPEGGVLAPPCRFWIACRAASGRAAAAAEGGLRVREELHLTSQEDFGNLSGAPNLAKRGIRVVDDPAPELRCGPMLDNIPDLTGMKLGGYDRTYPHVVMLPRWNQRSFSGGPGYSRCYGAMVLAPRQTATQGAELYWPFKDDFDGHLNNDDNANGVFEPFERTNGPEDEFWHELSENFSFGWPPPALPFPADPVSVRDSESLTPLFASSPSPMTALVFDCPGMHGNPGDEITAMSIEAWVRQKTDGASQGSTLRIGGPSFTRFIKLEALREGSADPARHGTTYRLWVRWGAERIAEWFIPDEVNLLASGGKVAWTRHVVLTLQTDPTTNESWFRLFVNGGDQPAGGAMVMSVPGPLFTEPEEWMQGEGFDDLRLYNSVLNRATLFPMGGPGYVWPDSRSTPDEGATARYNLGRFVRQGTYTSPLYVLGAQTRLASCRWTGFVPFGLGPGSLKVRLHAYLDDIGMQEAAGSPKLLDVADLPTRLTGLGKARSFRYEVLFDCGGLPPGAPLNDSPAFESIEFSFVRDARTVGWTDWAPR